MEDIVVAVLYDGASFGELSMMGASNKKDADTIKSVGVSGDDSFILLS